jgi:uncharacterized protein
MRIRLLPSVVIFCFSVFPLFSQAPPESAPSPEKLQDIKKLMELTGSKKLGDQVLDQMFVQLKQQLPKVPEKFWLELRQSFNIDEMLSQMAKVQANYFTHDEIKELIQFYESPAGRKLTAVMPKMTEESVIAGQKWVLKAGQSIEKKLEEAGYK